MGWKKVFAIALALLGLFIASLLYVNPDPGWFFLTGIYGCFAISIVFYAVNRQVNGKKASAIFTCLLSFWIGGYCIVLGIQEWPSMGGQMGVYTGIFCFVAVWLVYVIVNRLISMHRNWSARRSRKK